MFNAWNSLYPEQVKEVIAFANKQRFAVGNEKVKENSIIMTNDWEAELEAMPYVSKMKGKMSALLKMKSKISVIRKPRKTY